MLLESEVDTAKELEVTVICVGGFTIPLTVKTNDVPEGDRAFKLKLIIILKVVSIVQEVAD
jgi:hypothetical protein